MCDCESNIYNDDPNTDTIYSCNNIGSGSAIFAGSTVVPPNETFNFKTLKPGTNVSLTTDADSITISSTDTGITTLNNLGTGQAIGASIIGTQLNLKTLVAGTNISLSSDANEVTINNTITPVNSVTNLGSGEPVLVDVLAGSVRARTLVGVNGMAINNLGNEIQFSDEQIQTKTSVITYNYGQTKSPVDLSLAYYSPDGVVSNTVPICEYSAGNIVSTGLTTIDYIPGARVTDALVLPFETQSNNGTTANSEIKLFPNTLGANDYMNEYLMYTNSSGEIWQINVLTNSERLMVDYNGSNLGFGGAQYIAMDIADNLLFYCIDSSDSWIRYYDFATGNSDNVIKLSSYTNWSGSIVNIYFDQDAKVLYLLSSDYKYLRISIKPFNRVDSTTYIPMGMPSVVTNTPATPVTQYSFCIDNGSKVQYLVGNAGSNTKLWQISNPLGAIPFYAEYQNDLESVSNGYAVEFGASGRLYVGSQDSKKLYRFEIGQDILQTPNSVMTLGTSPLCITRSPYGITF